MDVTEQIRQTSNILEIASQYTTLQKRGKKHVGLCPFHTEKTPSFTVDDEKQLYHCFGCNAGGDIFTLVMEKENLSFHEALKHLADTYNIKMPETKKISPKRIKLEEQLYRICEESMAYFKKNLFNTKEGEKALAYLKKRNITDEIIQKLKLGYALDSWDGLLKFFHQKNVSSSLLEKAGLVLRRTNKEGFYDRFRGRIIFPIFTLSGKVVAFGGRTISGQDPKYLNSPDTPIYTKGMLLYGLNFCKEDIRDKGEVFLVEGYTDFLALFQSGIQNAAASLGTSLTYTQVNLARKFSPSVITCYDGDPAGQKAALRAVSLCFSQGVEVKVLILPENLDPDSFIQKFGKDRFIKIAENSIPGLRFLLHSFQKETKIDTPESKSKIAKNIITEIEKIPDSVVRSEYIKQVSEYISIDESVLRSITSQKQEDSSPLEKTVFLPAEKRLLQIVLDDETGDETTQILLKESKKEYFKGLKSEPFFYAIFDSHHMKKSSENEILTDRIDKELKTYLQKVHFENDQVSSIEDARDCMFAIMQYSLEKQLKQLTKEIIQLEKDNDNKKLTALLKKKQEITVELSQLSQRKD